MQRNKAITKAEQQKTVEIEGPLGMPAFDIHLPPVADCCRQNIIEAPSLHEH